MANTSSDSTITKVLTIVFGGIMTLLVAIQTWEIKEIVDIESKIGSVEGNRFTSADGLEVWKAIADIKTNLASLPNQSPPHWFIDRVDKMDKKLDDVADNVKSYQTELSSVEAELRNHELYDSKAWANKPQK